MPQRQFVFAASHNRREILVGFPTLQAIIGNKIAPWLGDLVLAKKGFKEQQTDEPVSPDRKNNVWEPVPEDRGAYGPFDNIAAAKSYTLWASMNRNAIAIIAGAFVTAFVVAKQVSKNKKL